MAASNHVSLPKPFASGNISEWFTLFDICCDANEWDNDKRATKLLTILEGRNTSSGENISSVYLIQYFHIVICLLRFQENLGISVGTLSFLLLVLANAPSLVWCRRNRHISYHLAMCNLMIRSLSIMVLWHNPFSYDTQEVILNWMFHGRYDLEINVCGNCLAFLFSIGLVCCSQFASHVMEQHFASFKCLNLVQLVW